MRALYVLVIVISVNGCTPAGFRTSEPEKTSASDIDYTVRLTGKSPDWVAYTCVNQLSVLIDDAELRRGAIIASRSHVKAECPVVVIDTLRPNAFKKCFEVTLACRR